MAYRIWDRKTVRGTNLFSSNRKKGVYAKIHEEEDQLLKALARHHKLRINALLVWALQELKARGIQNQMRPKDLGVGLKYPKRWVACNQRLSREEAGLWRELAQRYGGLRRAAVM